MTCNNNIIIVYDELPSCNWMVIAKLIILHFVYVQVFLKAKLLFWILTCLVMTLISTIFVSDYLWSLNGTVF